MCCSILQILSYCHRLCDDSDTSKSRAIKNKPGYRSDDSGNDEGTLRPTPQRDRRYYPQNPDGSWTFHV